MSVFLERLDKKIEKYILSIKNKDNLSLEDRLILEKFNSSSFDDIKITFYVKELSKVKEKIKELEKYKFTKDFSEEKETILKTLENYRKDLISFIKNYNSKTTKLKTTDFLESNLIPDFGEISDWTDWFDFWDMFDMFVD